MAPQAGGRRAGALAMKHPGKTFERLGPKGASFNRDYSTIIPHSVSRGFWDVVEPLQLKAISDLDAIPLDPTVTRVARYRHGRFSPNLCSNDANDLRLPSISVYQGLDNARVYTYGCNKPRHRLESSRFPKVSDRDAEWAEMYAVVD